MESCWGVELLCHTALKSHWGLFVARLRLQLKHTGDYTGSLVHMVCLHLLSIAPQPVPKHRADAKTRRGCGPPLQVTIVQVDEAEDVDPDFGEPQGPSKPGPISLENPSP